MSTPNIPTLSVGTEPKDALRQIASVFNNAMSIIRNALSRRQESVYAEGTSSPLSVGAFPVAHSLGKTPTWAIGIGADNGSLYYTDADQKQWTDSTVTVRFNVSNTKVRLLVGG